MTLQEKLHQLFLLDQTVRGLRTRLDAATRRRDLQKTRLDQYTQQRLELDDQLRHAKASAAQFENASKDMTAKVDKLREQMNAVRSNKEYSALLVEVNTLKVEQSKAESEALEQLSKVDDLNAKHEAVDKQVIDQEKLVKLAEAEVATCQNEVGERLESASTERNSAAAEVPEAALKEFERLADAYEGEAMAVVIEEDRKRHEYACGGCYMQIPVEKLNSLISRPESMSACTTCGRILFLDQAHKESLVSK